LAAPNQIPSSSSNIGKPLSDLLLIKKYPIISIEDPFDQDDFENFAKLTEILKKQKIPFIKEKEIILGYGNEGIGRYRLDFVIDDKIALEIKTVPFLKDEFTKQLLAYLVSANLKLGIIANFRTQKLTYKRVINPKVIIK